MTVIYTKTPYTRLCFSLDLLADFFGKFGVAAVRHRDFNAHFLCLEACPSKDNNCPNGKTNRDCRLQLSMDEGEEILRFAQNDK